MEKAAIIGYGRFGGLLASLAIQNFEVTVIESNQERAQVARSKGYNLAEFDAVAEADLIFLAVPISEFEQTVQRLAPLVTNRQVVSDLCSVKVYPTRLMQKYLPNAQLLGSHPMFGPDSAKKGLEGLQVAVCPLSISPEKLQVVTDFWRSHKLTVIETTPENHDKDSVYSQAFTYTMARTILHMNLPEITFKTRSFNAITEVAALSANDSEQLFHDMLYYNPYFADMKTQLAGAIAETDAILEQIDAEQRDNKAFEI